MAEQQNQRREHEDKFISFWVGEQEFCVDIMSVKEIRGWTEPTRIPRAPDHICGVINLRGAILPIIDFAARVGMPVREPDASTVIVVTQNADQLVGMKVDAVSDILSLSTESMQPIPDIASESAKEFFKGVVTREEGMIRIVDLSRIAHVDPENLAA